MCLLRSKLPDYWFTMQRGGKRPVCPSYEKQPWPSTSLARSARSYGVNYCGISCFCMERDAVA